MTIKNRLLAAIVFPLLVMAGWVVSLSMDRLRGTEVQLAVIGFDPRDLWSGHYLQYSLDMGKNDPCATLQRSGRDRAVCVCIEQATGGPYASFGASGACESVSCSLYLRGSCRFNRFDAGIERYYFGEKYAPLLQMIPPNSSITVSIGKSGNAQVKSFFVGGVPLADWLAKQPR